MFSPHFHWHSHGLGYNHPFRGRFQWPRWGLLLYTHLPPNSSVPWTRKQFKNRKQDHVILLFQTYQWPPISLRINSKFLLMSYKRVVSPKCPHALRSICNHRTSSSRKEQTKLFLILETLCFLSPLTVILFPRLFLFLKNKFIYLFLAALGLRCCTRAFSSCFEQGPLFVVVHMHLIVVASLVVEHGL